MKTKDVGPSEEKEKENIWALTREGNKDK